ncbi:MAG: hypothetical protein AAGJ83_13830 [Planctomycetota bacterium]
MSESVLRGHPKRNPLGWLLVVTMLLLATGCADEQGVSVYTIPKQMPEQLKPGKERMLVVMAPRGDQAWFFKLTGPEQSIDSVDAAFESFVTGLTFSSEDEPELETLPDGWKLGAKRPMRFATLDIDTPGKQLGLSISPLPLPIAPGSDPSAMSQAAWGDYVRQNVDRWRGQLGMDPDASDWGGAKPIDIPWAGGQGVLLDIVGKSATTGMQSVPRSQIPAMRTPDFTGPPAKRTQPRLAGDAPDQWRELEARGMRLMAFESGPEENPAVTTVMVVGGSLRGNVARWLGQVESDAPEDDAVDSLLENAIDVEVSDQAAQRFIIVKDDAEIAIDGTVVPLESGQSVFIKMTGPPDVVREQRNAMAAFLESLQF